MENFRCFAGPHEVALKPLTLLVGENSSGKSSFLAAVRLAWDARGAPPEVDIFNSNPFGLGGYAQLASHNRARTARMFRLGFAYGAKIGESTVPVSVETGFRELNARSRIAFTRTSVTDMWVERRYATDGRV